MRLGLFIGGVTGLGLTLAAAACGGTDSTAPGGDGSSGGETNSSSSGSSGKSSSSSSSSGGSTSSSSGGSSSSSGGSSSGGITSTELAKGFALLTGIAGDQVIYQLVDTTRTLNAVPITGGAPTKIADLAQGDRAIVRGGAVALYTGVANGRGTVSIWTKATGLKAGPAGSAVGLFDASDDGTRVVFGVNAQPPNAAVTGSQLAVVDTANVAANTGAMGGANAAINIADTCGPNIGFVGKTFFGAYCTNGSDTRARLVTVPAAGSTATVLVSNNNNDQAIQPYWVPDKTGAKVLVFGLPGATNPEEARVITVAGGASQAIENDVYFGALSDDGSTVYYRTNAGAFKRASSGATPNPVAVVGTNVKEIVGYNPDKSRVLIATTDPPQSGPPLIDLKMATTAAANTPSDINASALPLGFSATGNQILYLTADANAASLKAKPTAGGAEKEIFKDPEIALAAPSGDTVVVAHASKEVTLGQATVAVYTLSAADAAAGGAAKQIATDSPESQWAFKDKALVYTKLVVANGAPGAGSGLFVATLP